MTATDGTRAHRGPGAHDPLGDAKSTRTPGRIAREAGSPSERAHDPVKAHNAVAHGLKEIYVGPGVRTPGPRIEARDEIERADPGAFRGRVYFAWMEHDPDGGCDRDPVSDPHEDLGYVGKTVRPPAVRWAEHLARYKPGTDENGNKIPNNSAVYRHWKRLTGFSLDPRIFKSPHELADAEDRAIKALWPAWNIMEQDRRNPAARATRSFRKPDRLAPLIGLASVLWGLLWAAVTGGFLWLAWDTRAPWWCVLLCPLVALYIVNGTAVRHAGRLTRRKRRRGMARRVNRR